MRYVSLFSGIEAASIAFMPLGWELVALAETDKAAAALLAHHHPKVPNLGDVTKVDWHGFARSNGPVDLVVFGSPCQSFSVAGKRLGLDDPRGNLALYALSVVNILRPRWFLFENVPGLLSSDEGRDFGRFLATVGECGYQCAWRVLDAQYCRTQQHPRAVPQRRRRVFVVGCLGSWTRAAGVLLDAESLRGNPPPRREAGERIAPTVDARTKGGGGGWGSDFMMDGGLVARAAKAGEMGHRHDPSTDNYVAIQERAICDNPLAGADGVGVRDDGAAYTLESRTVPQAVAFKPSHYTRDKDGAPAPVAPPLSADADKGDQDTLIAVAPIDLRQASRGEKLTNNRAHGSGGAPGHGIGNPGDPAFTVSERGQAIAFSCKDHGADVGEVSPALRAMGHDGSHANAGGQVAIAFDCKAGGNTGLAVGEGPHDTANIRAASGGSSRSYAATPWAVRRLTPLECERLQGFPDNYTRITAGGKVQADGPRYKQLGNSMAVNVMEWIGHRIQMVERESKHGGSE